MNELIESYIRYIGTVRRYSKRTVAIYKDALGRFSVFSEDEPLASLTPNIVRSYEVYLLDNCNLDARTVNLHLSVLSGFCRYLISRGELKSNPVHAIIRPKVEKRLPHFFRSEAMDEYYARTAHSASREELDILASIPQDRSLSETAMEMYKRRLDRLIVSMLHGTGIRRSELISLNVSDYDTYRKTIRVTGKGDKQREIPLVDVLCDELELYLRAVDLVFAFGKCDPDNPLLLTPGGKALYPVYVDRAIKTELEGVPGISGRKSPHVLRHTIATELLNDGSDLNSIKELLGHSSLAATQVYTHNSIEKLKKVYSAAHPRAKKE